MVKATACKNRLIDDPSATMPENCRENTFERSSHKHYLPILADQGLCYCRYISREENKD
jgi:hypothetical protein